MPGILSNLYFLSLVVTLIAVSLVGLVATIELHSAIFPVCVTSVSDRLLVGLYRFVVLVIIAYSAIVILRLLIGGDINAH